MALAGGRELEAKDRTKEDITSPRATALSHDLFGNPLRMGVTLSVAAALLACLAATRWQLAFWKDSETLFRRAVAITEGNDVALNNLGTAVGNKGRMDEAEKYLRMSYQINPYNPALLSNLSMIVKQRGKRLRNGEFLHRSRADQQRGRGTVVSKADWLTRNCRIGKTRRQDFPKQRGSILHALKRTRIWRMY